MLPLPRPLVVMEVPEFLSPSVLGTWGGCVLKLAVASIRESAVERLASGPEAAIGTVVHRVLERWAGGDRTLDPSSMFEAEYDRARGELASDPRCRHFADLAATKSLAEWTRLRAWVMARCRAFDDRVRPAAAFRPPVGASAGPRRTCGPEIALESRTLRLRGRADRVRNIDTNVFEIRDFNSGSVLSNDGEVKDEIALQLQAYGLVLVERYPRADVRLVVDDGTEREVPFDEAARAHAKERIEEVIAQVPPPGPSSVEALVRPGAACWGCTFRHACAGYREAAPKWWKDCPSSVDRIPNDTWGTIAEVRDGERMDVVLVDDAGRRVRVDALDSRHGVSPVLVNGHIWFFEMESSGPGRGFDGTRYHPRAFHELPRDRRERRAWSAQVFGETPAGESETTSTL